MKKTSKRTSASRKRSRGPSRGPARPRDPAARALVAFAKLAERERIRWYVFGAEAVNLYGFPRKTADLDLTIDLGERPVTELVPRFRVAGFDPRFLDEAFIQATRVMPLVDNRSGESEASSDVLVAHGNLPLSMRSIDAPKRRETC